MIVKNLYFFDKDGYNLNFDWNSEYNYWEGNIYLPKVSVGIYASTSIYVLENINNEFYFPNAAYSGDKVTFTWDFQNKFVDEFFMFEFRDDYVSPKKSSLEYVPNDGPQCETLIVDRFDEYDIELSDDLLSKPLPMHIGFFADEKYDATTYNRTLIMSYNDKVIARIKFYEETVEEDERLKIWNANMGYKITPEDSIIFYKDDINEPKPDYQLLNEKRKELMMEGHNIYPYIGSYKAIINAIKFFGYNDLSIIEFWKNINKYDENFGKVYHSSKYSLSQKETLRIGNVNVFLPNENYKKLNKIALTYSIRTLTGEVDEWELPQTAENFAYTIEEALIKLFALKKKLNTEFMPGSSRITDIIGEANYFGLNGVTMLNFSMGSIQTEPELELNFDVLPGKYCNLTDNRYFYEYVLDNKGITGYDESEDSSDTDFEYDPDGSELNYLDYVQLSSLMNISCEDLDNYVYDSDFDPQSDMAVKMNKELSQLYLDYYNEALVDHTIYDYEKYDNTDDPDAPSSAKVVLENKTVVEGLLDRDVKWTISRSSNQVDEDYKNVGIEKNYTVDDETISSYSMTIYGSKVFFTLPYYGYYDVVLEIGDEKKTKKKCIKVEPYDIEMRGFYYDTRELPEDLDYTIEEGDVTYRFIYDKLNTLIGWAVAEKTGTMNKLDIDFTMPTYDATTNAFIHPGPYKNENINYPWEILDNITYEMADLESYVQYARYIRSGVDVKPYTWFLLTYNYGKIVGKCNPKWTIRNEGTGVEEDYVGKYFTCLLKEEGNYSISLSLEDSNGNKYQRTRNIFVVSDGANYKMYQTFKTEYDDLIEQQQASVTNNELEDYTLDEQEALLDSRNEFYLEFEDSKYFIDPYVQISNNEIWYTSTDGNVVTPVCNGISIVSNNYTDGNGVIVFDGDVTKISSGAFKYLTTLKTITLPDSVTTICDNAFNGCTSLSDIKIPYTVSKIEWQAFNNCKKLTEIKLPDNITSIENKTFVDCINLTNITIPSGVISIGDYAFKGCLSLESVDIPSTVVSIGECAFEESLKITDITIPSTVTTIGSKAFHNCDGITSMYMPNDMTVVEEGIFSGCVGLTDIDLPDSATIIKKEAFSGCEGLKSVIIPDSVTTIEEKAFYNCNGIVEIKIGTGITSIGENVFENCSHLTSLTCEAKVPPTNMSIDNLPTDCYIYVPYGSLNAYKAADNWIDRKDKIKAIP